MRNIYVLISSVVICKYDNVNTISSSLAILEASHFKEYKVYALLSVIVKLNIISQLHNGKKSIYYKSREYTHTINKSYFMNSHMLSSFT